MASREPCRPKPPACRTQLQPEPPLRVKVVGLFKSSSFQMSKTIAETLKNNYPSRFEDPVIVPLQEFAWDQYLQEKKRHDYVYLDICIDLAPIGRLIFELYGETCPKTCKNFQVLCTGTAGFSERGIKLHYKDSIFHRVVQNGWIQGGDIVEGKGDDGESIYGPTFEDENFSVPHNKRGVLGMVNKGHHTNGSQFYITLQAAHYLDKKYVAFGQLIEGTEVLRQLELVPTENERPMLLCSIADSGILYT
ncbi:peptidyl-prolyl cis-trans isomerase-like 6 isoform X3 [Sigmodon hispidus]